MGKSCKYLKLTIYKEYATEYICEELVTMNQTIKNVYIYLHSIPMFTDILYYQLKLMKIIWKWNCENAILYLYMNFDKYIYTICSV